MKRIGLICLALVLALGSLGVGYAYWTDTLYVEGTVETGELDWRFGWFSILDTFAPPLPIPDWTIADGFVGWPYQVDKNVGWGSGIITNGNKTLALTFHNVYPSYFNRIAFYVENCGTIPLKVNHIVVNGYTFSTGVPIVALDLDDDGYDDIEILWVDNFGVQIHPGAPSPGFSFWIHILCGAPQGATLSFTIEVVAVQYNAYPYVP